MTSVKTYLSNSALQNKLDDLSESVIIYNFYLINKHTNKSGWIIDQLLNSLKHLHHKFTTLIQIQRKQNDAIIKTTISLNIKAKEIHGSLDIIFWIEIRKVSKSIMASTVLVSN